MHYILERLFLVLVHYFFLLNYQPLVVIEPPLLSASTWLVMAFLKELNLDPLGSAILKKLPRFNPLYFHFISVKLHVLKRINECQLII